MVFHWRPKNAFSSSLRIVGLTYHWAWKHQALMLGSTKLNRFSITNITTSGEWIDKLVETTRRYDGKASCMSKQTVSLFYNF